MSALQESDSVTSHEEQALKGHFKHSHLINISSFSNRRCGSTATCAYHIYLCVSETRGWQLQSQVSTLSLELAPLGPTSILRCLIQAFSSFAMREYHSKMKHSKQKADRIIGYPGISKKPLQNPTFSSLMRGEISYMLYLIFYDKLK